MPVPIFGNDKEAIIRAMGEELAALEARFDTTQQEVVDEVIERTFWSLEPALEDFLGGRHSPEERLAAIIKVMDDQEAALRSFVSKSPYDLMIEVTAAQKSFWQACVAHEAHEERGRIKDRLPYASEILQRGDATSVEIKSPEEMMSLLNSLVYAEWEEKDDDVFKALWNHMVDVAHEYPLSDQDLDGVTKYQMMVGLWVFE